MVKVWKLGHHNSTQIIRSYRPPPPPHTHTHTQAQTFFLAFPRLRAVPIFPFEIVEPWKRLPNFRAPAFTMSFRGSTNSRGKIGTARNLGVSRKLLIAEWMCMTSGCWLFSKYCNQWNSLHNWLQFSCSIPGKPIVATRSFAMAVHERSKWMYPAT